MSKASALCWGRERSFQAEGEKSPQIMADPDKFRDSRPLKERSSPHKDLGSPLTWDITQTSWRVYGSPRRSQLCPGLLAPPRF